MLITPCGQHRQRLGFRHSCIRRYHKSINHQKHIAVEGSTISLVYPADGTTPSKYTKDYFIINETLNGLQYSATVQPVFCGFGLPFGCCISTTSRA